MCERLPPSAPDRTFERRALLGIAGGLLLGACTAPRARRLLRGSPAVARAPRCTPQAAAPARPGPTARPVNPAARARAALEIVPRAAWGAAPMRDNHDPMAGVHRLTLHHTDSLDDLGGTEQRDDPELMRVIQRFHQDDRGWADIGYHFVIGRDGRVYEGRPLDVQGAHAGASNNVENLGVSVIGNFETGLPTGPQMATVEVFLAQAVARWHLAADALFGHRDLKPTECPGDALYAWFGAWKSALPTRTA